MDVIYFLIPLALILLVAAVAAFFWAVRHDQFEDLDREANRILFDEDLQRDAKTRQQDRTPPP